MLRYRHLGLQIGDALSGGVGRHVQTWLMCVLRVLHLS